MSNIKYITPREFLEGGFLQEVNRQFLHPLGLALSVSIDVSDPNDDGEFVGIWDYREDPEGMVFGGPEDYGLDTEKAANVQRVFEDHFEARKDLFGQVIQPLNNDLDKRTGKTK